MRTVFCGAVVVLALLAYGTGRAEGLPAGPGREAVEAVCTGCHGANLIERSAGYTHGQWDDLIAAMVDLTSDPETKARIVGYLAEQFPPGDSRAATRTESELAVDYEEWVVPTLGQRARDPSRHRMARSGGSVSGQTSSAGWTRIRTRCRSLRFPPARRRTR